MFSWVRTRAALAFNAAAILVTMSVPATLATADDGAWSAIAFPGASGTFGASAAVYDPVRDRMLLVRYNSQVWAFDLAGTRTWSLVATSGTPPPPLSLGSTMERLEFSLIYDSARDRLVLFGGGARSNVWALALSGTPAWSEILPSLSPPAAQADHAAIYDPARDRMIVFGGWTGTTVTNQAYALTFSDPPTWTPLVTTGSIPEGRRDASAIYDPVHDRMVVYGGVRDYFATPGPPYVHSLDDIGVLDLASSQWTWVPGLGEGFTRSRADHSAVYDSYRGRMVVFGGRCVDRQFIVSSFTRNDVWSVDLAGTPAWTPLSPTGTAPHARYIHAAIYDPLRDDMLVVGGEDTDHAFGAGPAQNDAFALDWTHAPTAVVPDADATLSFAGLSPNPASGALRVSCVLRDARPVVVELLDLAGRPVLRRDFNAGAGRQVLDLAKAGEVAPGVYFVSLSDGRERRVRRCTVLH